MEGVVMKRSRVILTYFFIVLAAAVSSLNYHLFVFPNRFAPSGLNGLCTMFQFVTGLSMGYLNLLLNIPLAFLVYKKVSKTLAVRTITYVAAFSVLLLLVEKVDLSAFAYSTTNGTSTIMGPLVGGIASGLVFSALLRAGTYGGGTDFVASLIHKSKPHFNFFWVSFVINCIVAGISYFIYGHKIEPVLMCILYSFATSSVMDKMNRAGRSAIRFEIMTRHPEELSQAIVHRLHHSATLIPGKGIYRGEEVNVLICVVNKSQVAHLSNIIRSIPDTFAVSDIVSEVIGNFKHLDSDGKQDIPFFDPGEGTGI